MEHMILLLSKYRYFILFPLAIVEGPILAVLAGFLCMRGVLNIWIVFPVILLGDAIGDSICFAFGKFGIPAPVRSMIYKFGFDPGRLQRAKRFIEMHPRATIPLSKLALGVGVLGIYLIGHSGISYRQFIRIALLTSFFQYLVYLGIGVYFGQAYALINHYLNYTASIFIIFLLIVGLFVFIQSIRKRL
jgi:membrane-associated protein